MSTILNLPSLARTVSGNSGDLPVGGEITELAVDTNITAVAGTSPTLQLILERKEKDLYFPIWQSVVVTDVAKVSTSVGEGLAYAQSFGEYIRFKWVIGGTGASFVFSSSIIGK
jgi:hypothetical protein